MKAKEIIACWLLSCLASSAFSTDEFDELSYLDEMPMVLSAVRIKQPINQTPVAITVITRDMIEATGATEIPELLRLVPGFQVARVSGNTFTTTYHGFADQNGRRLQVLVDGRPTYDIAFGGPFWQALTIPISEIERIEVIRGPNAASYGSNSFLAAVNIITREPDGHYQVGADYLTGSIGMRRANAYYSDAIGNLKFRASISKYEDNGFPDGFVKNELRENPDDTDDRFFNYRSNYDLDETTNLRFNFGFRKSLIDDGKREDGIVDIFQPPRTRELNSGFQQLVWEKSLLDGSDLRLQFFHNALDFDDTFPFPTASCFVFTSCFVSWDYESDRYDLEAQYTTSISDAAQAVMGAGIRYDRVEGRYSYPDGPESRLQYRAFGTLIYQLNPDLLANFGFMIEDVENVGTYISPRVSLNYSFQPQHSLRLAFSKAHRLPAFFEQFGATTITDFDTNTDVWNALAGKGSLIQGNEDLVAAEIKAYEIGFVGRLKALSTTYDIKIFRHDISNGIKFFGDETTGVGPLPNLRVESVTNEVDVRIEGLDLQATYKPDMYMTIHGAYAYTESIKGHELNKITDGGPEFRTDLLEKNIAQQTASLLISYQWQNKLETSVLFSHVDRLDWPGEGDWIGNFNRVDARIAKEFRLDDTNVELSLMAHNLLNQGYQEFVFENTFERRIFGQVKITVD